jgi:hypothetical protein
MFRLDDTLTVYLHRPAIDFRTGINGLAILVEQARFIWPDEAVVPTLTVEQLHWLLDGIDLTVTQRHPQRFYERVA